VEKKRIEDDKVRLQRLYDMDSRLRGYAFQIMVGIVEYMKNVENTDIHDSTFFLGAQYFDRYIQTLEKPLTYREVITTAVTCIFIAIKLYRGVETPLETYYIYDKFFTENKFDTQDVYDLELVMLQELDWDLYQNTVFETYDLLLHTIKRQAVHTDEDLIAVPPVQAKDIKVSRFMVNFMARYREVSLSVLKQTLNIVDLY
jgi:hypothetical protein